MTPPAPGLFSTITCCPSSSLSFGAISRAMMSLEPPGEKPTTMRTGFEGKLCAVAIGGTTAAATAAKALATRVLRLRFM